MSCPRTLEQQAHKTLGGFAPKNLSNNHEIHAIEQCKFALLDRVDFMVVGKVLGGKPAQGFVCLLL